MNSYSSVVRLEYPPRAPEGNRPLKLRVSEWLGAKKDDPNKCQFFDLVLWGKNAEFAMENYRQGDFLQVQGEIRWSKYEAKDGTTGFSVELVYGKTRKTVDYSTSNQSSTQHSSPVGRMGVSDDADIPF